MNRRSHVLVALLCVVAGLGILSPSVFADNVGVVSSSIVFDRTAGGGGEAECEPYCAPPLPALYATKTDELLVDRAQDGFVNPGDTLRFRMLVGNVAPVDMHGVVYVEHLDARIRAIPGSWKIRDVGAGGSTPLIDAAGQVWRWNELGGFDFVDEPADSDAPVPLFLSGHGGAQLLSLRLGTLAPDEFVEIQFDAIVDDSLPFGVSGFHTQGSVFAETTSPVLTDDPSTGFLQDATWTPIGSSLRGTLAGGGAAASLPGLVGVKQATVLNDPEVPWIVEPGGEVEYRIAYRNDTAFPIENVVLTDLVGPYLAVQSDSLQPGFAHFQQLGAVEVVTAQYDRVEPGAWVELIYTVTVSPLLPPEIGHTGSRALACAPGANACLSDDVATQLLDDPTSVLFPNRCVERDWSWDDWLIAISEAPTGLFPLVLQEKDKSHHLRWVLYGADFFGDLSVEPSARPPLWPEWAMVGLVEMDREVSPDTEPGFRLAQRQEAYVEAFLESEPFFMWADYNRPIYGRVPATDKGELLECEGFDRFFCDRLLLPLLVTLDWSRDWDMRWLEDDLIVATRMDDSEIP